MESEEEVQFSSKRKAKAEAESAEVPLVPSKPMKDFEGNTIVMIDGGCGWEA